jgi:transcriptional regulator with XRE-family HTH domain
VHHWTGLEAKALRLALRLSVRAFAQHLGLAVATVSKWESKLADTEPRPDTQAILDTALGRADASVHLRFETLLSEMTTVTTARRRITASGPRAWEYESWADDLDRVVVALSRQNFTFADSLLTRWLGCFKSPELDDKGLYLFARSTALLGDLKRDQGAVLGPLSAQHSYADARAVFTQLDIPRRVAQLDLSLAVVTEMSGKLDIAARSYESLAVDDRLSGRDRARARLWVGTALSKDGNHDYATSKIFKNPTTGQWPTRNSPSPAAAPATSPRPCTSSTSPAAAGPPNHRCNACDWTPLMATSCSPMRRPGMMDSLSSTGPPRRPRSTDSCTNCAVSRASRP